MSNLLTLTDSYKVSHHKQYPKGTEIVYSYFESRGGRFDKVLFFGLQYLLKKYFVGQVITQEKIDEADELYSQHFGRSDLFNRAGWEYILKEHGGKLPISIKAVPEGSLVDASNILMSFENTDPKCYWLTNYLETLGVQVWYPTTVATQSYQIKKMFESYADKTGQRPGIEFKLHDFGFRGVSSVESASIGGAAHILNFSGTDTVAALSLVRDYYGGGVTAFSIPASEHSTITSWGKDGELEAFKNMLDQYPNGLIACVSDSFDIYKACREYWGTELKEQVLGRDGTLVVRPDSGNPPEVVCNVLNILGDKFGYEINEKGYKVLNPHVRVIQGDGCNYEMIKLILEKMEINSWSIDNIAFGMGGALLQKLNRDTQEFAFKCSAVKVNGEWKDVYKQPVTDETKVSKKGRLQLVSSQGIYRTVPISNVEVAFEGAHGTYLRKAEDELVEVFRDGELVKEYSWDQIRKTK